MKELIQANINRLQAIKAVLENTPVQNEPDNSLNALTTFIRTHGADSALTIRFASLLQLSNDDALISTFDLHDIGDLYSALLEASPDNIEYCIEAAYFFDFVLGNNQQGKALAGRAQILLIQQQEELEMLITSLNQ